MKKNIIILGTIVLFIIVVIVFSYGKKIKLLYNSLDGFKNENLAYTFQNMYKIQPKKQIEKGDTIYKFEKEILPLPASFDFKGESYSINDFLTDTHTSGLLVIKDDIIKYESYYLGANENTLFSSNSMGKSFVSALMGIAISEGYISSVNDPIGKYIPEFKNTEIESIPIKACLQMASGINFDEDNDMSKYSIRTLLGASAMKLISKVGLNEEPYTHRRYLSINTEILGEIIRNSTGYSLSKYMEENLWKKIGVENEAYWTLNNEKELAMGGLCVSLRDYARFARLYLNNGKWEGEQIIPTKWIQDSVDASSDYSKPGVNNDSYNAIGYGYQWWIPEGNEGEFMAIGVYSQWIYINPTKNIIIVKTSADPNFMEENYELKSVEFFREISKNYDIE